MALALHLTELVPKEHATCISEVNVELTGVTAKVLIVNFGNCYFDIFSIKQSNKCYCYSRIVNIYCTLHFNALILLDG